MTNIPKTYHTHTHAQNTSSFVIPSKTMYALNSLQKEIRFVFLLFECIDIYFTPPSSSWIEMFLGMCFNVNWDSKIPTFQQWMSFQIYVTFISISLSTTVLLQVTSLSQTHLNRPIPPTKQASKSRPDSRCTWRDDKRFTCTWQMIHDAMALGVWIGGKVIHVVSLPVGLQIQCIKCKYSIYV